MIPEIASWAAVALGLAASTVILIHQDWRTNLGALAAQYLAVFWLTTRHLPFAMGSIKLIAGWMVVAILGMTRLNLPHSPEAKRDAFYPRGAAFRLILMGIAALAALGSAPRIEAAIPGLGLPVITGGLLLIGAGAGHLSVTSDLTRITMGLLTLLSGFEILYAAVESAILVIGLLSVINLGMGMLGAYLLTAGVQPPAGEGGL